MEPSLSFGAQLRSIPTTNSAATISEQFCLKKARFRKRSLQLRAVLKVDPNYAKAYYTLANALAKQGDRSEAIASYGRALKLLPDFPDAHTNLANLMLETGNTAGALEHYRQALQLQPNNPQTHYNLAVGLIRGGDSEAAIPELQKTLELDPKYPDAGPLLRDLLAKRQQP